MRCLFFLLFLPFIVLGQDEYRISSELGLYKSSYIFANNPSIYLQTSFGKKINNDFWLSLDLIKVNASGEFESNIFVDRTSSYNAFIVIPNFTKDFEFKSFCFSPSLGLLLIHESVKFPDLSGNSESPLTIRNQKENTFGLYLNLVLKKELNKNLIIGLNVKSYVIINLEIETFMIGPSVEIRL